MPRGDKTGPNGQGSKTGRAAGYCSGNNEPGCTTAGGRGGMSGPGGLRGAGAGRGMRRGLNQGRGQGLRQRLGDVSDVAPSSQDQSLSRKAQELEQQIAEIKDQLKQRS